MKITNVKAIPTGSPEVGANGSRQIKRNFVYVKVETDEGLVGWGESTCGPLTVASMVDEIGATLIGKDPFSIEKHWHCLLYTSQSKRDKRQSRMTSSA